MAESMADDRGRDRLKDTERARAGAQRETGDRMIGWGVSIFRSQVSAIRYLLRALRFGCSFRKSAIDSVICHPSSIQSSFQVAGGSSGWRVAGFIYSALHSVLNAVLHSVLSGKFGPLSSIQSSAIDSSINSAPLCRDAVPTLPSAAEPRGGSG